MGIVFEHMEEQIQLALLLIYSPLYHTSMTQISQNAVKTVVSQGTIGGGKGWREPQIALICICIPYLGCMKGLHNFP